MLARVDYHGLVPRRINRDDRRAEVAEAVWRVIRERGIGAVSLRNVAAEADIAVASVRHVLPTRAQLMSYSAELMIERVTARVAAVPPHVDPRAHAVAVLTHLLPLDAESRAEMDVNLALIAETPALPELGEIRDRAHHALGGLCLRLVFALTGRPPGPEAEQQARTLHALLDGLAMHLMMRPSHDDPSWAVTILRDAIDCIAAIAPAVGGPPPPILHVGVDPAERERP